MLIVNKNSNYFKNKKSYRLIIDGKETNIILKRIDSLTSIYLNFIKSDELFQNEGFFMHKPKIFTSFMFKTNLDLLFVNAEGSLIQEYLNLKQNKITRKHSDAKFLYILPKNYIKNSKIELSENITINHRRLRGKKAKQLTFKRIVE